MDWVNVGVETKMTAILGTMVAIIAGLISIQTPISKKDSIQPSSFLPCPKLQPSKYAYERFSVIYAPIWIVMFGSVVVFQLYEDFTATTYNVFTLCLALPYILQPILVPSAFYGSPDESRPLTERYSFKANIWLATYSFIGNYWYTHYFYSVLKASYTCPATRFNNVPLCMYFATHFYFSFYHVFSNAVLRKIVTTYEGGVRRLILYVGVIVVLSYFTAFMETLTISSFPYYTFEDRNMAYTVGSAFYGIYFLVSFPAFFAFDQDIDSKETSAAKRRIVTVWDSFVSSCGYGMMILILLDFVRLNLGVPLIVGEIP